MPGRSHDSARLFAVAGVADCWWSGYLFMHQRQYRDWPLVGILDFVHPAGLAINRDLTLGYAIQGRV